MAITEKVIEALRAAPNSVDAHSVIALKRRCALVLEGDDRDVLPSPDECPA
jgi:hypothetical protein